MLRTLGFSIALATLAASAQAQTCAPDMAGRHWPGDRWQPAYDALQGWSEEGLDKAFNLAERNSYAAGMLVHQGKVIRRFGDVERAFDTGAIRHTLVNPLVGQLIAEKKLSLDADLRRLNITERPPLSALEGGATVRHLLTSTSGVHRLAADTTAYDRQAMPARDSARPGQRFWYNKWGFNVLAGIVEKSGGERVFAQFDRVVAQPVHMQDYTARRAAYRIEETLSVHPGFAFDLSTRDRARFGLLYLRKGCWDGRQVIDPAWVKASTSALVHGSDGFDFGYLWWSQDLPASLGGRVIMARGDGDQLIALMPELDAVLVLTSDLNAPSWLNWARRQVGLLPGDGADRAVLLQVLRSRPGALRRDR